MKKHAVEAIKDKLEKEISDIRLQMHRNKKEINRLSDEQRKLKDCVGGLYELLRMIKS